MAIEIEMFVRQITWSSARYIAVGGEFAAAIDGWSDAAR
jgi:hypothetical protein